MKEAIFVGLSCISLSSLFCSFAGHLEAFEVYRQKNEIFIVTENSSLPYGLNKNRATLISSKYNSDILSKILLIGISGVSATTALVLSSIDFDEIELSHEIKQIEVSAQKQLKTEQIKNKYALMSIANREQFRLEMQSLLELTGGDDTMNATELNATDKMINIGYLIADGHSLDSAIAMAFKVEIGSEDHENRKAEYSQWLSGH